jgi:hypothetical protein
MPNINLIFWEGKKKSQRILIFTRIESVTYKGKWCTSLAEGTSVDSDKAVLKKMAKLYTALKFVQNKYKKRFLNLNMPKNETYIQNNVDVKYTQKD